jgi:hypothetical protein
MNVSNKNLNTQIEEKILLVVSIFISSFST